jgi:hypothetical protein
MLLLTYQGRRQPLALGVPKSHPTPTQAAHHLANSPGFEAQSAKRLHGRRILRAYIGKDPLNPLLGQVIQKADKCNAKQTAVPVPGKSVRTANLGFTFRDPNSGQARLLPLSGYPA